MEFELIAQMWETLGPTLFRGGIAAIQALLARNPDVVATAIAKSTLKTPDYAVEPALERWTQTEAFHEALSWLVDGRRGAIGEFAESFIDESGFYVVENLEESAKEVLAVFFGELLGALLRGPDGILVLHNRVDRVPADSAALVNQNTDFRADELKAEMRDLRDAVASLQVTPAGESTSHEDTFAIDSLDESVEPQLSAARELIQQGNVRSARVLLQLIKGERHSLSPVQEFRLATNLGVCALAMDDEESAFAEFDRALKLRPNDPMALANGSVVARLREEHTQAEDLARKALAFDAEHSQAGVALIEALHARGALDEIEMTFEVQSWMATDGPCRATVARVFSEQHRFDESIALARGAVEIDPVDIIAGLTLAVCLLSAAQKGQRRDAPRLCSEVIKQSDQTWGSLDGTEMEQQRLQVLTVRGAALAMLGSTTEAIRDFDEVLRRAPGDSIALLNRGLALCAAGEFKDGRLSLEQISDEALREQAILPLAAAALAANVPLEAVAALRGSFSLNSATWEDVRRAEILIEAEIAANVEDTVSHDLAGLQTGQRDGPLILVLQGSHSLARGDAESAEQTYQQALELVPDQDKHEVLWRLANCYSRLERYNDGANCLETVVNGDVVHEGAIPLLFQLRNSLQVQKALQWSRRIRSEHPQPSKFALLTEAEVLTYLGDSIGAVRCWEEICKRDDATMSDLTSYAQSLIWIGSRDDARAVTLTVRSNELRDEPRQLLRLANVKLLLGERDGLDDAYNAWRYGIGDPDVHLGYFSMFMSQSTEIANPQQVTQGCAVLLKEGSTEEWWNILDHGEELRGQREFLPADEGTKGLLGGQVGGSVVLRDDVEQRVCKVLAIQSKYVRAFQEIAVSYSTRFPTSQALSSIPADPDEMANILGLVDERHQFVRDLEQLYLDDQIPLSHLFGRLQRPAPEVWRACTRSGGLRVRFSQGTDLEAQVSAHHLSVADSIVLDMVSLLTLHRLALGEQLKQRFKAVRIPQCVIDEIRQMVFEVTVGAQPGGYLGRNVDGTYAWVELTEAEWLDHQSFARSVLEFVNGFDPIAAYPAAEFDYESVEGLRDFLTPAGAGAIFAGDEDSTRQPLLVSDDYGLSSIAGALGIHAVNSQGLLLELRRCAFLTDLQYSSHIAELASMNYRFIRVNAADVLRLLEENGYVTDGHTLALLGTLEGPDCNEDSAVAVISDIIVSLSLQSLLQMRESLLITALLGTLHRGRGTSLALRKCLAILDSKLSAFPTVRYRIQSIVRDYIAFVNG